MIVEVRPEMFVDFFKEGNISRIKTIKGLPKDAEFEYCFVSDLRGTIQFVFSHSSFNEVSNGQSIPKFPKPIIKDLTLPEIIKEMIDKYTNENIDKLCGGENDN